MCYRCIRFNINKERNQVRDTIQLEQRTWVCWKMAHRTVRCATGQCPVHQAVQLQTSHSWEFQGALHYNSPDCPVSQRSNGSLRANGHLPQWTVHVRSQRALDCPVWHQTIWCSKMTKAPMVDQLWTLTIALMWRAPDSPVCPSPAAFTNGYGSG
jgi:hypothetical protein